jgi:mono/diheme cytochrome c family protein
MSRFVLLVSAVWLCAVSGMSQAASPQAAPTLARAQQELAQTVKQYCVTCHNARANSAATATGVILDTADLTQIPAHAEMWEKVVRRLRTGSMPPPGMPRPDPAAAHALVEHLEGALDRAASSHPNPGRHALHRLNRSEYANAIRDLLSLDVDTATLLPPDDSADGFDNNASLLGVSPALLERYLSAAAYISELAVGDPRIMAGSETYRVRGDASQVEQNEDLSPGTRGGLMATHTFPLDGEYVIRVRLLQTNLGSIRGLENEHQLEITLDGERVLLAAVGGPDDYVTSSENATDVVNSLERRLAGARAREGRAAARRRGIPAEASSVRRLAASTVPADDAHRHGSSWSAARGEHDGDRTVQRGRRRSHAEP